MPSLIFVMLLIPLASRHLKTYVKTFTEPFIVLYRIVGNDLPPRHSVNQTLTNLIFILENEPSFNNVKKIWILNRIVNNELEDTLISLLNQFNRPYIRIPFRWEEYRQVPYYFPLNYPPQSYFHSKSFYRLSPMNKIRLIDTLYHEKNLYAMNSNAAKNLALRHGKRRTQAQWFMVFDSNCFLSQNGFADILQALVANGSRVQYFFVPMIRLIDNNDVFRAMTINATEEPQTIFRRDSTIEFLETIRYGRGPKLELLALLGAVKRFWRPFEWEPAGRKSLVTFVNNTYPLFQYAGLVFRLYSGYHPDHELLDNARGCSRLCGIYRFLENLDLHIGRPKLLPKMLRITSNSCSPWTIEEIRMIIETARERSKQNSVIRMRITSETKV